VEGNELAVNPQPQRRGRLHVITAAKGGVEVRQDLGDIVSQVGDTVH